MNKKKSKKQTSKTYSYIALIYTLISWHNERHHVYILVYKPYNNQPPDCLVNTIKVKIITKYTHLTIRSEAGV